MTEARGGQGEAGLARSRFGRAVDRLARALARPVDIAWLAAFRALFGVTMCVSMVRFIAYGWIDPLFVEPRFHFKYYGFSWVEPLSAGGMHALFAVLAGLALMMAAGLFFRVAAFAFALGFTYLQLVDVTNYLNHYYLASLLALLLAISPANAAASLDAFLFARVRRTSVPTVWLALFRVQVGLVYAFAGLAKAHADWLLSAQPLRIWLAARTDTPLIGGLFVYEEVGFAMSWAGFLFDSTIPLWLSIRRARPYAYAVVVVFHVLTRALFPIGMFPVIMVLGALVFFSPSWPRVLLSTLRRVFGLAAVSAESIASAQVARPLRRLPMWAVGLFAAYCFVQVAWPLRFLAYGGDVRWHEQGMRFSWRVMLREKSGSANFLVRSPLRKQSFYVPPLRYLTRLQEREMVTQPDLILQFAHFLRDEYARRGYGPVSVFVETAVSLNGRPNAPLIDPERDLAAVADGFAKADWILPRGALPPPSFERERLFSWSKVP